MRREGAGGVSWNGQASQMPRDIVVFYPDGQCLEVDRGATLVECARQARVSLDSECGGQGACGKCKVIVRLGQTEGGPSGLLAKEEIEQGYILACQARVTGDLVVEVPPESQKQAVQILMGGPEAAAGADAEGIPLTRKVALDLSPPSEEDRLDDLARLQLALREKMPLDAPPQPDLEVLRALPLLARGNRWRLDATVADLDDHWRVIRVAPPGTRNCGVAIDLGTTTVVVELVDLDTGGLVGSAASLNGQIAYGQDVISRIMASGEQEDGIRMLHDAAVGTINKLIDDVLAAHGVSAQDVTAVSCAGNTVMTHFLLGVDPAAIRRDPYIPAARRLPVVRAGELGIEVNPSAVVRCQPCVSSYVGGDITSGVLVTEMAERDELGLLIDMGTNGEMVVGNSEWLVCCSCSAGPAFEGSGIEHGMYAGFGCIERIEYDLQSGAVDYSTIGKGKPRGICGSGLVDALATLLRAGVIDRAGKIDLGFPTPRVQLADDQARFVLVWASEAGRENDIYLTEADIQNLIRAKAAVFAGTSVLLESMGFKTSQLDRTMVAGAFGNYLDSANAVTIGLLPDIPLDKIRFVGNTSLAGARMTLLSRNARQRADRIAAKMTNFELSTEHSFMEKYVAAMFLPHTDLSLFPSVAGRLKAGTR